VGLPRRHAIGLGQYRERAERVSGAGFSRIPGRMRFTIARICRGRLPILAVMTI